MKSLPLAFILATTPVALALSGCGAGQAQSLAENTGSEAAAIPVEVRFATRGDIYATYSATANISTEGDAPVLAKVAGEVRELLVEEGQHVEAGQVLARLDGERLRLEMLSARANLEQARGEYRRYVDLHARGLVSKAMFEGLKYDLDALQATHDLKELNYEYSSIRAPIAGVVSGRTIKLGESVKVGQEAFRITDTSELLAELQIPQTELPKFATGHKASLEVDSIPQRRFPAEIIRISPTIDVRNGSFRATAFVENTEGALAPGMFARITVAYEKHSEALIIPAEALIEEDNRTAVYVVSGDTVDLRQITIGIRSEGQLEVLAGLDENEQVVVIGQSALRDGSKVLARLENTERYTG